MDGISKTATFLSPQPNPTFPLSPYTTFSMTLKLLRKLLPDNAPSDVHFPPPDLPTPAGATHIGGVPVATIPFASPVLIPSQSYTDGS